MSGIEHWSHDEYWTDALDEYVERREHGLETITIDLKALQEVVYNGDGPAYRLLDGMRSVWELEDQDGYRGAPRLLLATLIHLSSLGGSESDDTYRQEAR